MESGASDSHRKLESVKKTREVLITDPNSKAHLSIGKLKAVRKRAGLTAARTSSGSDSGGSAGTGLGGTNGVGFGGGGSFKPVARRVSSGSDGSAFLGLTRGSGSGGMDGLLEAAATLSDSETPETPRRDQSGEYLRDRSPRISGINWEEATRAMPLGVAGGGACDAAVGLGALRPGGAFTAVRPMHTAAAAPPPHVENQFPQHPQASRGGNVPQGIDSNAYAMAMAALLQPPGSVNMPQTAAATAAPAMPSHTVQPGGMPGVAHNMQAQMAAMGGINPHMAHMLAWMAALGGAAQQHQPPQQQHPMPAAWNPAVFQQMAAAMSAGGGKSHPPGPPLPPAQVQAPAPAPAVAYPKEQEQQVAHQPL